MWPSADDWYDAIGLASWNTAVVVIGAALLGLGSGVIGCFMLLRKRALLGDALSHATLPGIAAAYLLSVAGGYSGKSLPILLAGAIVTGALGVITVLWLRHATRLAEDTALGIVLSVFFGAGVALLGIVQQLRTGHAAGLESFIDGKTAAMTLLDTQLIGAATAIVLVTCGILFRPLKVLCFDQEFAHSRGLPVVTLDVVLMTLVVLMTVVGLQAVGLILVIAMLVIPSAAARFWTDRLGVMLVIAGGLGAASAYVGAIASAVFPAAPSGPLIVVAATAAFIVSMFAGTRRGVLRRWSQHRSLKRKVARQHLLRGIYERIEALHGRPLEPTSDLLESRTITRADLLHVRSWSARELTHVIRRGVRDGVVVELPAGRIRLTRGGAVDARRIVHEHRLWETYLIHHADIAPSHVDRDADAIEHVLSPEIIAELESILAATPTTGVLASPHRLEGAP